MKETKRRTRSLEKKVRDIVNKHDPIRLLRAYRCPDDEYSPEIKIIMPLLRSRRDKRDFYNLVYEIFVRMFDRRTAGPKKNYLKFTEKLYSLKEEI